LSSIADLQGRIRYCNDAFVQISGFAREQLVGAEHNIVRHPDVPPAVFAHMWQHLKQGKPWMGIVKNRCQNGDHYWVNAYVTPIMENGEITGYESVRVKPEPEQVRRATALYARMAAGDTGTSRVSRLGALVANLAPPVVATGVMAAALSTGHYWVGLSSAAALLFGLHYFGRWQQQRTLELLRTTS